MKNHCKPKTNLSYNSGDNVELRTRKDMQKRKGQIELDQEQNNLQFQHMVPKGHRPLRYSVTIFWYGRWKAEKPLFYTVSVKTARKKSKQPAEPIECGPGNCARCGGWKLARNFSEVEVKKIKHLKENKPTVLLLLLVFSNNSNDNGVLETSSITIDRKQYAARKHFFFLTVSSCVRESIWWLSSRELWWERREGSWRREEVGGEPKNVIVLLISNF